MQKCGAERRRIHFKTTDVNPMTADFVRPRLMLATTLLADGAPGREALSRALAGGDVASVILDPAGRSDTDYQAFAEPLVPLIQEAGAAAIVVDDTRCAGRVRADGIHVTGGDLEALGEAIARFAPKAIVGTSGFHTRHESLEAGERMPDYLLFGPIGGEDDAARPADIDLASWWAAIVEVPAVLSGGGALEELPAAAASGAEFILLSRAVFGAEGREGEAVAEANALFDALERSAAA